MKTITALLAALLLTLGLSSPASAITQPTGTVSWPEYAHAQVGQHLASVERHWNATPWQISRHTTKLGTTVERFYNRVPHGQHSGIVIATFFRPAGRIAFLLVEKQWCNGAFYCTA